MYCVGLYVVCGCMCVMYFVCMCMGLKRRHWVLAGMATVLVYIQKGQRTKVEAKDRPEDKYQCLILILIMRVIYDFDL